MSGKHWDAIVVGLGAMGSATLCHLAKRGYRALGIDMYPLGHTFGSSHGEHRIIREAYYEDPGYVPLVRRAYALWRELEAESGDEGLLTITGGLMAGPPEDPVALGTIRSAEEYGIPYDLLTPDEVAYRFPGFRLTDDLVGVYEANSGYLRPERCVAAHLQVALDHGAAIERPVQVTAWEATGNGVQVTTDTGTFDADKLVVTAGPWASELLSGLRLPLNVVRIVNVHFDSERRDLFGVESCPIFMLQVPTGQFYGFPWLPEIGLKVGRHDAGEPTTARTIRREIDQSEIDLLRGALDQYMPGAGGPIIRTLTCMYTLTPDEHFIIDHYPGHPNVVFGCGFSGHGFKFASVMGEVLTDLAVEGRTEYPVGFLSMDRFTA